MITPLQIRKTDNNDDKYLVIKILNASQSSVDYAVVNLTTGIGKVAVESEIQTELPTIVSESVSETEVIV